MAFLAFGVACLEPSTFFILLLFFNRRRGPKRYDYNTKSKEWISLRDGSKIKDVLSTELSIITKKKIELPSSIDGE
jgi:hypothetical protein